MRFPSSSSGGNEHHDRDAQEDITGALRSVLRSTGQWEKLDRDTASSLNRIGRKEHGGVSTFGCFSKKVALGKAHVLKPGAR